MIKQVTISISLVVLFFAVSFSIMSCEQIHNVLYDMPYSIEEAYIQSNDESENTKMSNKAEISNNTESSEDEGTTVHIRVRNLSVNDADSVNLSFRVYRKSDGKNPLLGDNEIRSHFEGSLKSGYSSEFIIDISNKISSVSPKSLVLDHIYVSKIQFHDGSVWSDLIGLYAIGGEI